MRAAFNLLFGVALLIWMAYESLSGLLRGGGYAVVDGVPALAIITVGAVGLVYAFVGSRRQAGASGETPPAWR